MIYWYSCYVVYIVQVYLHLLRLYLSTADDQPLLSLAEETDQNALETNLSAAFRLLGEQANRIDTVEVFLFYIVTVKIPIV